jgi:hypothetical protein
VVTFNLFPVAVYCLALLLWGHGWVDAHELSQENSDDRLILLVFQHIIINWEHLVQEPAILSVKWVQFTILVLLSRIVVEVKLVICYIYGLKRLGEENSARRSTCFNL